MVLQVLTLMAVCKGTFGLANPTYTLYELIVEREMRHEALSTHNPDPIRDRPALCSARFRTSCGDSVLRGG
jgi:hypothetical protein